jgi:hypothetical protein
MKKFLGLRGQALNLAVGTIAGCDFLLFGYGECLSKINALVYANNTARQTRA